MCYDAEYQIKRQLKEASRLGASEEDVKALQMKLWKSSKKTAELSFEEFMDNLPSYYHVSGFAHPSMVMLTDYQQAKHEVGTWGLIPFWVKTIQEAYDYKKPYNSNLNAQSESMFEKKGFKKPAKYNRCAISLDAYYESHHQNKKTYPFRIFHKENKPLWVAGIFQHNELADEKTGEVSDFNSVAILTCTANHILSKIHNNPKMVSRTGHRMLVILDESQLASFLVPYPETEDPAEERIFEKSIEELCKPYDEDLLHYEPVRNLKPRKDMEYLGNVPEIRQRHEWADLDLDQVFG